LISVSLPSYFSIIIINLKLFSAPFFAEDDDINIISDDDLEDAVIVLFFWKIEIDLDFLLLCGI